ncbi:type II toxin-antitoxin system RelE/ParE family toxin [Candidatus Uhrbacteria bacterium]|nr:type II toxin-antitoxin system RelE/ParE family toxin [Candidatus Uhrbacteria bacterium]
MPDHIQKFLRKIPERQRKQIEYLIEKIMSRETAGLDIQKLKGIKDVYRLKKGDMRIIYRIFNDEIMIIAIERRSDTTYNKF